MRRNLRRGFVVACRNTRTPSRRENDFSRHHCERQRSNPVRPRGLDCFVAVAPRNDETFTSPRARGEGAQAMEKQMRRKVSAPDWRFPRRMTRKQWSMLPYRWRHAYVAHAMQPARLLARLQKCAVPAGAALRRAGLLLLGAQAGDDARAMGQSGSRLHAAARASGGRFAQRFGRLVAVLSCPLWRETSAPPTAFQAVPPSPLRGAG